MKWKYGFNLLANVCFILFFLIALTTIFELIEHIPRIWFPDSDLTKSLGEFDPIFGNFVIEFDAQPSLYSEQSFLILSFVFTTSLMVLCLLFLWFMRKLLKNIYKDSLFMYENVSIIYKLGVTILVFGTATNYTDQLLSSRMLQTLTITNANVQFSNYAYLDAFIGGVVLLLIGAALKHAVSAVEENKHTI